MTYSKPIITNSPFILCNVCTTDREAKSRSTSHHLKVYKLMKEGLSSHKIGNKRVFLKEDLTLWIKEH